VYRTIAAIEFQHAALCCNTQVEVPARLDGRVLAHMSSDHLLIEDAYLLDIRALLDQPSVYEFARTKTYLNSLGLKHGFVVNFGKKQLQIYGVSSD
jgi:GxxExxY protein